MFSFPELRYYQLDVLERARARLRQRLLRVLIQAPTGAGKTFISSEMVRCAVAKGKRVLFLAHRRRLITQKCDRLEEFGIPYGILMRGHGLTNTPAQVASRDTLLSRAVRGDSLELPPADLVIVDEAHTCLSDEYQRLLSAYAGSVFVGLTATPARSDGRGMAPFWQALECTVGVEQLVREGFLVPVRCYAPEHTGKGKRHLSGDPVSHWRRFAEGRPTVLFTGKVATSLAVVESFCKAGVPAEHMDANTPDKEREAIIARVVSGRTKVVSNPNVLTEGVDIPELSCCQMLRLAGSYVLFAQAVGRVMRAHPSKKDAVLIDHSGAVFEHGFPDEDVEWSLDEGDTVDHRNRKAREEGKRREPICCPNCAYLFSGSAACPACGHVLPRKAAPAPRTDEILVEVIRNQGGAVQQEARQRLWDMCLGIMARKGRTMAAASCMYRAKIGEWPEESGLRNAPEPWQRQDKVADVYPQYLGRARS